MKISVVIPTLDEADHIEAAIRGARGTVPGGGEEPQAASAAARTRESRDGRTDRAARVGPATGTGCGGTGAGPGAGPERGSETATPGPSGPAGPGRHPAARRASPRLEPSVEIVVVDGGSRDGTVRIAAAAGARVLRSEPGRARQLGVGARASGGDVVLLLHADTRLPAGWAAAVCGALRDPGVVGGAFRFRFDDRSGALRWIEWGARLRGTLLHLPYGDQALFVRRETLEAMGGIPQSPLMEDLDLVREIRRRGRLALLPLAAVTSARRYRDGGPLRTMLRHWLAAGAWRLGVGRARIARWARR